MNGPSIRATDAAVMASDSEGEPRTVARHRIDDAHAETVTCPVAVDKFIDGGAHLEAALPRGGPEVRQRASYNGGNADLLSATRTRRLRSGSSKAGSLDRARSRTSSRGVLEHRDLRRSSP